MSWGNAWQEEGLYELRGKGQKLEELYGRDYTTAGG